MSIDRRIVSILYYNNIFDIENVEKFIGEKENYYEILMNGNILKLKIPGKEYTSEIIEKIETDKVKEIDKVSKSVNKVKKETYTIEKEVLKDMVPNEETNFEEELLKSESENKKLEEDIKPTTKTKKSKKKENIDDDLEDFINLI